MPRKNLDESHFAKERMEWTKRKHKILERVVVPSLMKLSSMSGRVAAIDAYAGPNQYGEEIVGSTVIMCEAAKQVTKRGRSARVFACEPNLGRFEKLVANLELQVSEGILTPLNMTHAEAIATIQSEIVDVPALTFLDPQTASEMEIDRDILPWAERPRTDILGIFMATQVSRICASPGSAEMAQRLFGTLASSAGSINGAYDVFRQLVHGLKHFVGLYRLRKLETEADAYGFFGLSDAPDGYWLLSEAVAKDFGTLMAFDAAEETGSLFAESEDEAQFDELCHLAEEAIRKLGATASGQEIAVEMLRSRIGVEAIFGRFTEPDFRQARDRVLGLPSRRKRNA